MCRFVLHGHTSTVRCMSMSGKIGALSGVVLIYRTVPKIFVIIFKQFLIHRDSVICETVRHSIIAVIQRLRLISHCKSVINSQVVLNQTLTAGLNICGSNHTRW